MWCSALGRIVTFLLSLLTVPLAIEVRTLHFLRQAPCSRSKAACVERDT